MTDIHAPGLSGSDRRGATSASGSEPSLNQLVGQFSQQVTTLFRDELKLAQLEMTGKAKRAGIGAGALGTAAVLALYGGGCLVACVILALVGPLGTWGAALVVGGVLVVVAGLAALVGLLQIKKATPPAPTETIASVKLDVNAIKPGGHA
ncbi:MAG: phage holin family protein [Jatrophihabitans sp.]|uniref:phage holin family protein n=1 Tax=Jatrophihabitans sp. TaxID=1932789 RepID=UPI003F80E548